MAYRPGTSASETLDGTTYKVSGTNDIDISDLENLALQNIETFGLSNDLFSDPFEASDMGVWDMF